MATFDFPSALKPAAATVQLNRMAQTFRSPFGGSPQVGDVLSERWQISLFVPPALLAASGEAEALSMRLAGGYNRVRVEHPIRPVPSGTLWGTPVVHAGVAAGASQIVISGGFGVNMLRNAGMEIDSNANGSADLWITYVLGGSGVVTRTIVAGLTGNCQRVASSALGGSYTDRAGVYQDVSYTPSEGEGFTASAQLLGTDGKEARVALYFLDGSGVLIGSDVSSAVTLSSTEWRRGVVSSTAPNGTESVRTIVWLNAPIAGPCHVDIDQVQLVRGADTGEWVSGGGTVKSGDVLGINGQWLQVAEDAEADDNDRITATFVNRLRSAVTAGAAVVWDHPTIEMAASGTVGSVSYAVGASEGLALDLEEVW